MRKSRTRPAPCWCRARGEAAGQRRATRGRRSPRSLRPPHRPCRQPARRAQAPPSPPRRGAWGAHTTRSHDLHPGAARAIWARMLPIDLSGKRALVAGVADDGGFGFAIAKAMAEAGASVCLGTWPPALGIFQTLLRRGKLDASLQLGGGRKLEFERVLPLDAEYDTLDDVPPDVRENKR